MSYPNIDATLSNADLQAIKDDLELHHSEALVQ